VSNAQLQDLFLTHTGYISDKWEQYLGIYDSELTPIINRGTPISLLEIGVQNGGSLQIWEKYLPSGSEIVGIDVDPKCARLELAPSITVAIADATREEDLGAALGHRTFDVIVDDGSHRCSDVIQAFHLLFERLRQGGKYFIEDIHCSYWTSYGGGWRKPHASIEWLKGLVDDLNADHFRAERLGTASPWTRTINRDVARVAFYDSLAVVEKLRAPKHAPYRRLLTGEAGPVDDQALWFATAPTAELATVLTAPSAARHIERRLLDQVALLRDECGKCKAELAGHEEALAHSRRELASRDEALAHSRRELANRDEALAQSRHEAQLALASRDETLARLHANQSEFSRALAERDGKIDSLMQTLAERDGQIQRLKQTAAKRDKVIASLNQAVAERDHSRRALQAIRLSTSWRLTAPLRFVKRLASSLLRWFLKAPWIPVRSFYRVLPLSVRSKLKNWLFGSFHVLFAHSPAYRRWLVVTTDHTQRVASLSEKPLLVASVHPEMPHENGKRDPMHESAHRDDEAHTAEPADKSYNVLDIPYDLLVSPPHLLHDHEVCVFVTYSPTRMLCQPTLRYIEGLRQSGMKVLVVTATDDLRAPANVNVNLLTGLIVRGNHGYDFAAWATALAILPDLWNARILVLANDSVYGPTSQLALNDVLERIRQSTSDVIGLTESHQGAHHIQSYFIALKGHALSSEQVRAFWDNVRSHSTKQVAIDRYELTFLAQCKLGQLTHEILFPLPPALPRHHVNPTLIHWRSLATQGFPFIKAQLLRDDLPGTNTDGWEAMFKEAPYMLRLINDHLRSIKGASIASRTYAVNKWEGDHFSWSPDLLSEEGVITGCRPLEDWDLAIEVPFADLSRAARVPSIERVAVVAHMFYPRMLNEILEYLSNIPFHADIFISTDTHEKRNDIASALSHYSNGSVEVQVFENRGRDIASMIVGFRNVFSRYEIFLHIHSKRSPHNPELACWRTYLFEQLLGSKDIVESILYMLRHSDVGIVFPQHFPPVRSMLNFGHDYELMRNLMLRAGISFSTGIVLEFPSGSMFWGKSAALRKLLDLQLEFSDFPAEEGQFDGTLAHAVERSFLYFAESSGARWAKVVKLTDSDRKNTVIPVEDLGSLDRVIAKCYRRLLGNCIPSPSGVGIKEVRYIWATPECSMRPRLTLLIPTLQPEKTFGGIATALRVFDLLLKELQGDFDARIVSLTDNVDAASMRRFPGYQLLKLGATSDYENRIVVDASNDRAGQIPIRRRDLFIGTAWWTAVSAFRLKERQMEFFERAPPVIYFIQDHEPDFYGWSARYALARGTYMHPSNTIALINSEELCAFMQTTYNFNEAYVLPYQMSPALSPHLSPRPKRREIVLYGRPGTPRNGFEIVIGALHLWQQRCPTTAGEWAITSVGEAYPNDGVLYVGNLRILGKLPPAEYIDLLNYASVGISLMISPHPSYPPLEMAQAGLITITNSYRCKDLSLRHENIVSIERVDEGTLADAIENAVKRAEARIGTEYEMCDIGPITCSMPAFDPVTFARRLRELVS
jgi:lipopolysaccharide biosynthesis protein